MENVKRKGLEEIETRKHFVTRQGITGQAKHILKSVLIFRTENREYKQKKENFLYSTEIGCVNIGVQVELKISSSKLVSLIPVVQAGTKHTVGYRKPKI